MSIKKRNFTFPFSYGRIFTGKQYLCIKKKRSMINTSAFQGKKAAYYTLGCKLNFSETSTFGKLLSEMGVTTAHEGEHADICLINTCSVTEVADHKCRQAIHRMVRENPDAFVVVTGCYAQLEPETVSAIDGVDLVLGSNEKANLIQYLSDAWTQPREGHLHAFHHEKTKDIKTFQPSCSRGNRTRYFLKVQDGCDYFCTYCTIPYARGFSRNPTIASLVEQARQAASEGGKEIVLTGVNIGEFGKTTGETFLDLVKALLTSSTTSSSSTVHIRAPSCRISTYPCRAVTTKCLNSCTVATHAMSSHIRSTLSKSSCPTRSSAST